MKDWKKPNIITIREDDLKQQIYVGACTDNCRPHSRRLPPDSDK